MSDCEAESDKSDTSTVSSIERHENDSHSQNSSDVAPKKRKHNLSMIILDSDLDAESDLETDTEDFIDENDMRIIRRSSSLHSKRNSLKSEKELIAATLRQLTVTAALDEFTEMNLLNEDKQIFGELFDKIDPDDNGDVDEKEWIAGLSRLEVDIAPSDMSKIFKLMNGDKSGYIDRQDWITFCMTTYQSNELQRIQDSVLTRIKGHSRQPSNMFNPMEANEWNSHTIINMQQDMQNAAMHMGAQLQAQVEAEQMFYEDIEVAQSKDPDFGKIERASEWTPQEVAWWLDSIELSQYARKFVDEPVDGNILLNDVDRRVLQQDMNVKSVHIGKILREINKLRELNQVKLSLPYTDWNVLSEDNIELTNKLEECESVIKVLRNENAVLRLQNMSSANLSALKNPYSASLNDIRDINDVLLETKNCDDVDLLHAEIEHLQKSKIGFAERTSIELDNMKKIIKILAGEYQTLQTPMYEKLSVKFSEFNPLDSIIRYAGYESVKK